MSEEIQRKYETKAKEVGTGCPGRTPAVGWKFWSHGRCAVRAIVTVPFGVPGAGRLPPLM